MAILTFDAHALQACINDAQRAETFIPKWDGPVAEPKLLLVVGHGVHIMSNNADKPALQVHDVSKPTTGVHYAAGMDPFRSDDWMQARKAAFRDFTGMFHTTVLNDVQLQIDRGADQIRLSTDGYNVRVFTATQADYLIGGTYSVPSGLGGSFYVELCDITDMVATVRNVGNCEDFDEMQPYSVPLDELRECQVRRAA